MKKSSLLALGAVAVVGYMIYKNQNAGYGGYSGQGQLPGGYGYAGGNYGMPQGQGTGGMGRMPGNRRRPVR